jgi:hypothetical protein
MAEFRLHEFFTLYGNLSLSDHPEQLSELYGEAFVAADPERTGAFPNDDAFKQWLRGLHDSNIAHGMQAMDVLGIAEHPLGEIFVLTTVTWGARYEKTRDQIIPFDVSYMVNVGGDEPKIIGYFSHKTQEGEMRKWGLL